MNCFLNFTDDEESKRGGPILKRKIYFDINDPIIFELFTREQQY